MGEGCLSYEVVERLNTFCSAWLTSDPIQKCPALDQTGQKAFDSLGTLQPAYRAVQLQELHIVAAAAKTEGVMEWGGLWMRVDDANHPRNGYPSSVAFDNMHDGVKDRSIKGTTGWQNYSVVLDVPEGATGIYIGFSLAGPGALWVNGMKVEVVGPEIPVTGRSASHTVFREVVPS